MVGAFGEVMVMDWGVARSSDGRIVRRPAATGPAPPVRVRPTRAPCSARRASCRRSRRSAGPRRSARRRLRARRACCSRCSPTRRRRPTPRRDARSRSGERRRAAAPVDLPVRAVGVAGRSVSDVAQLATDVVRVPRAAGGQRARGKPRASAPAGSFAPIRRRSCWCSPTSSCGALDRGSSPA